MIQLDAVLDFSDALVFVIALPNILGLYVLAPVVKKELKVIRRGSKAGNSECAQTVEEANRLAQSGPRAEKSGKRLRHFPVSVRRS